MVQAASMSCSWIPVPHWFAHNMDFVWLTWTLCIVYRCCCIHGFFCSTNTWKFCAHPNAQSNWWQILPQKGFHTPVPCLKSSCFTCRSHLHITLSVWVQTMLPGFRLNSPGVMWQWQSIWVYTMALNLLHKVLRFEIGPEIWWSGLGLMREVHQTRCEMWLASKHYQTWSQTEMECECAQHFQLDRPCSTPHANTRHPQSVGRGWFGQKMLRITVFTINSQCRILETTICRYNTDSHCHGVCRKHLYTIS